MKVKRMDHVSINIVDLEKVTEFFVDIGLKVNAKWEMDGKFLDTVVGLDGVKTECIGLGIPDGQTWIELVKYHSPQSDNTIPPTFVNSPGIRHICFTVEDIDAIVEKLYLKGFETFSDIQQYEDSYKLCYVKGPEGIIVELAEEV